MEFPVDVCLLRPEDLFPCPSCDVGIAGCTACGGSGFEAGSRPERCPRCGGTGFYDAKKGQRCFGCGGRGYLGPLCPCCEGTKRIPCVECVGTGSIPICRAIGHFATADYIDRIADVMEGCSEAEEADLVRRGERLYLVLRSVCRFVRDECPERIGTLFPESVVEKMGSTWDRIRERTGRSPDHPDPRNST